MAELHYTYDMPEAVSSGEGMPTPLSHQLSAKSNTYRY
ncbi:hypothetical protein SAMN04489841_3835 [Natrinema salaciae]|uniref:Uncharacterized protein n=1 Tax=Natrinema salaciae TaxID=1186196 RepID=A0A1H9P3S5_9EURY|nr:hypothetical protein SAMN04489841_3835 [Natrinema salaciae]